MRLRPSLYPVLALLAALPATAPSFGLTFVVDRFDDEPTATGCSPFTASDCSLRGAVLHANGTAAADEILLPNGVYQLTVPGVMEDLGNTGDLDIRADLTVRSALNANPTIVQTAADRIFHVLSPSQVAIFEGPMTLLGGFANGNNGVEPGGSIYVTNSNSLSLTNVTLAGGSSQGSGGCLYYGNGMSGDNLTLTDVTVTGCSSGSSGGGILVVSDGVQVLFERLLVENCHASTQGGGLDLRFVTGPAIVQDSIVRANTAGGPVQQGHGGGISLSFGAHVRLVGSSVVGNSAGVDATPSGGLGGGVDISGATLELRNSTISGNRTRGGFSPGPAADIFNATLDLDHTTVVDNLSGNPNDRAIRLGNSTLIFEASIVEGGCFESFPSTMTSQGYNVERPTDGSMVTECDLADPSDVLTAAVAVRPLAGNGGPTPTHALAPDSPAQLLVPSGTCAAEDQRHAPRSLLFCDAGSFETSGQPPGPWIFADGYESGDAFAWSDETP